MQAEADAYTAVCPESYSRTRVLAGYSGTTGQDAASETDALGGIAIIDISTKRLVSKVCFALRWLPQMCDSTTAAQALFTDTSILKPFLSSTMSNAHGWTE